MGNDVRRPSYPRVRSQLATVELRRAVRGVYDATQLRRGPAILITCSVAFLLTLLACAFLAASMKAGLIAAASVYLLTFVCNLWLCLVPNDARLSAIRVKLLAERRRALAEWESAESVAARRGAIRRLARTALVALGLIGAVAISIVAVAQWTPMAKRAAESGKLPAWAPTAVLIGVPTIAAMISLAIGLRMRKRRKRAAFLEQLNESQEYDLLDLCAFQAVVARGTGQSITTIYGELENRTEKRLRVTIRPGTYFVSSGAYQNMVVRATICVTLGSRSTDRIQLPATCINAGLPIPAASDRFRGIDRVSGDVARFVERATGENAMVVQAGVWALTDGYTQYEVQAKLRQGSNSAISDRDVARARQILTELGIRNRL